MRRVSSTEVTLADCDLGGPWTTIEPKEFDQENSYVSESMFLVLEDRLAQLLPDEKIQAKAHALTCKNIADDLNSGTSGTLFLTSYRVLFQPFQNSRGKAASPGFNGASPGLARAPDFTIELPLCSIASVKIESCYGSSYLTQVLEIGTKDFKIRRFGFPYDFTATPLSQRILSINQGLSAALVCVERPLHMPQTDVHAWDLYDPNREYQRLKLVPPVGAKSRTANKWPWRVTNVNKDYSFCPTYPAEFIVPAVVSDEDLWRSRRFRMKERVPAITYLHSNGASMSRCAQPMVGLRRARGMLDEKLIAAIKKNNGAKQGTPLFFVDCRNQTSALANFVKGGGFESTQHYKDSHVQFMDIENIHSMREAFRRIYELCRSTAIQGDSGQAQWLSLLENTRWLEHVRAVLLAAKRCASAMEQGSSLVVHCSDGWDRTAQVCALTSILLDPYYRTMRGFQVLVEKEWCSFGHRFADRCGHSGRGVNFWEDENCSPVFVQFLDCVWQLMEQFPFAFEFNGHYLCALQSELYAARSGTFLQNNECERSKLNIAERCFSVWALLRNSVDADKFSNPFYMPTSSFTSHSQAEEGGGGGRGGGGEANGSGGNGSGSGKERNTRVLTPDCHPSCIKFWTQCYFKHLMASKAGVNQETCAKDLLRAVQEMAKDKELLEAQLRNARRALQAEHSTSQQVIQKMEVLREDNDKLKREVQKASSVSDPSAEEVLAEDEEDGDGVLLTRNRFVLEENLGQSGVLLTHKAGGRDGLDFGPLGGGLVGLLTGDSSGNGNGNGNGAQRRRSSMSSVDSMSSNSSAGLSGFSSAGGSDTSMSADPPSYREVTLGGSAGVGASAGGICGAASASKPVRRHSAITNPQLQRRAHAQIQAARSRGKAQAPAPGQSKPPTSKPKSTPVHVHVDPSRTQPVIMQQVLGNIWGSSLQKYE